MRQNIERLQKLLLEGLLDEKDDEEKELIQLDLEKECLLQNEEKHE
ncbi:MAG: hypothetical protein ACOZBL_01445 [Patescibacteria group bacterium]